MSDTYLYLMRGRESEDPAKTMFRNCVNPCWSIDQKIAWFKRREFLRTHRDAWIPESRPYEKEFHHWWHTKGKYQSMKHYVDGMQPIY